MNNELNIVMYHYVRPIKNSIYSKIKGLEYDLFKEQIQFLSSNYNIISMEQMLEFMYANKKLPINPLLLTFDDGYVDHFKYALPLLKEYNIKGSFYIPGKTFSENVLLDVNKVHFILANSNLKNLVTSLFEKMDYYRVGGGGKSTLIGVIQNYTMNMQLPIDLMIKILYL